MNASLRFGGAILLFAAGALGTGCGGEDAGFDQAMLAQYRTAIPKETQLSAKAPTASIQALVGDPAMLPAGAKDIVTGINGSVGHIIKTMETIVATEPTIYKADTKEFVWGPYKSDDGFGTVAAYIKDEGTGGDFHYVYALLRGATMDLNSMKPVIWGGATPDEANGDHGAGVTLWDFEANYAFEQANNPDFATLQLERGRFVSVYGKDAKNGGEATFVVAVLRGFVPKDKPDSMPTDLDYLYGRFNDGTNQFDFINFESAFDVDKDPAKTAAENFGIQMAFFNEGTGKAEATASGGDLAMGQTANVVECWDKALAETYLSFESSTNGVPDGPASVEGAAADCGAFQKTLTELGVPALSGIDPALMATLDDVAKNGVK